MLKKKRTNMNTIEYLGECWCLNGACSCSCYCSCLCTSSTFAQPSQRTYAVVNSNNRSDVQVTLYYKYNTNTHDALV